MIAWTAQYLIVLGIVHVAFGLVKYRAALGEALREGWLGRLGHSDTRRAAFWFISAGPLIALIGLFLHRAALTHDQVLLVPTGAVLAALALAGISAFPKSPLWALVPPALALLLA